MDNSEIFDVTKIMNNIKNHDFTVQTYRMTKEESEIVLKALEHYKCDLQLEKMSVADIFGKIGDNIKRFDEDTRKMQLFDMRNQDNGD